jgi:hypothetical protein
MTKPTAKQQKPTTAGQKVATVLFLLFCIYAIGYTVNKNREQTNPSAGIGQTVRNGNFEFIVNSFKCGQDSYGFLSPDPQGQYCLLEATITNADKEPHHWLGDVKLFDADKRQYDKKKVIDTEPEDINADINPGNATKGTFVFDVPKDVQPTTARLSDMWKDGASVKLHQ